MRIRFGQAGWLAVFSLLLGTGVPASAAQLRFHFVPVDACGNVRLQPSTTTGTLGEYVTWLGAVRQPYDGQPRPTHFVTFRHAYTGRTLIVPVRFPEATPRLEYRPDRIIYNYGSYTVE